MNDYKVEFDEYVTKLTNWTESREKKEEKKGLLKILESIEIESPTFSLFPSSRNIEERTQKYLRRTENPIISNPELSNEEKKLILMGAEIKRLEKNEKLSPNKIFLLELR